MTAPLDFDDFGFPADRERGRDACDPCHGAGPDLTGAIMNRLGYVKAPAGAARRRRFARAVRRASLCAGCGAVLAAAFLVYSQGPQARRPSEVTLPAAIGADVDRHRHSLEQTIRTIRNLAPHRDETRDAEAQEPDRIDDEVDRSAIGPVRWL